MRLVRHGAPFRQVVGALLLDVRLRVYAVLAGEFLRDRVLDFDALDGFAEVGEGAAPTAR
jgi:hypothetical protein